MVHPYLKRRNKEEVVEYPAPSPMCGEADELKRFAFRRLTVGPARRLGARRIRVATDGELQRLRLPLVFEVSPQPLMLVRPAQTAR